MEVPPPPGLWPLVLQAVRRGEGRGVRWMPLHPPLLIGSEVFWRPCFRLSAELAFFYHVYWGPFFVCFIVTCHKKLLTIIAKLKHYTRPWWKSVLSWKQAFYSVIKWNKQKWGGENSRWSVPLSSDHLATRLVHYLVIKRNVHGKLSCSHDMKHKYPETHLVYDEFVWILIQCISAIIPLQNKNQIIVFFWLV